MSNKKELEMKKRKVGSIWRHEAGDELMVLLCESGGSHELHFMSHSDHEGLFYLRMSYYTLIEEWGWWGAKNTR